MLQCVKFCTICIATLYSLDDVVMFGRVIIVVLTTFLSRPGVMQMQHTLALHQELAVRLSEILIFTSRSYSQMKLGVGLDKADRVGALLHVRN
ncbi:hypothetical protein D3C75_1074970 [compost metagenome]